MTGIPDSFTNISMAIQLALAPAFLLTGIAGLLNVMTGRLSRIIDRGRALAERNAAHFSEETLAVELELLERRRHYTSVAITAGTYAALLVCMVIAALFLEVMLGAHLRWFIGGLFTIAMLTLVVGLSFFLREVSLATRVVHLDGRQQ